VKLFESCWKYSEEILIPAITISKEVVIPRPTRGGMVCMAALAQALEGEEVASGDPNHLIICFVCLYQEFGVYVYSCQTSQWVNKY
jgi:hypothetical protein